MAQFETWLNADLSELPRVQSLSGVMFTQDVMGNLIGVAVKQDGEDYTITGTITGYVIRGDNSTVVIAGDSDSNKAWIELNEQAYAIPGPISIMIRETVGDVKTVLCACRTTVMRSSTDAIIDPGEVLPSVAELTERVEALESGAVDLAGDISDLEDKLGAAEFVNKTVPANGDVSYTFTTTCSFVILACGSTAATRSIIWGYCTGSGTVGYTKMDAGSSNVVTVETSPYLLTLKNSFGYGVSVTLIKISGTAPT